jgi:hypothetical protein
MMSHHSFDALSQELRRHDAFLKTVNNMVLGSDSALRAIQEMSSTASAIRAAQEVSSAASVIRAMQEVSSTARLAETIEAARVRLPDSAIALNGYLQGREEITGAINRIAFNAQQMEKVLEPMRLVAKQIEDSRMLTEGAAVSLKQLHDERMLEGFRTLALAEGATVSLKQLHDQQRMLEAFRRPELNEAAEQFAKVKEAMSVTSAAWKEAIGAVHASALTSFLPSQDKFIQLVASLKTPWVNTAHALSSFESVARLAAIGNAIHVAPFDTLASHALRAQLGDWSQVTFPKEIVSDWRARQNFYYEHGFDLALTHLPEPAFTQSLYETGILRPALFPRRIPLTEPESKGQYPTAVSVAERRRRAAYAQLSHLETHLRVFIHRVMTEKYGERWETQRVPGDIRKQWEEKRQNGLAKGETEQRLLWYADFTDYVTILLRSDNWREVFKAIFLNETDIRVSFQRLHPIRLPVMHARLIKKEDFLLLTVEVQRILRAIGRLDDTASC